jgi:hypothetical protein
MRYCFLCVHNRCSVWFDVLFWRLPEIIPALAEIYIVQTTKEKSLRDSQYIGTASPYGCASSLLIASEELYRESEEIRREESSSLLTSFQYSSSNPNLLSVN